MLQITVKNLAMKIDVNRQKASGAGPFSSSPVSPGGFSTSVSSLSLLPLLLASPPVCLSPLCCVFSTSVSPSACCVSAAYWAWSSGPLFLLS